MNRLPHISYFARVDFREDARLFGIYQYDRMMGMYILGKTGSGKTNLIKTIIYQDLLHRRGLYLCDINGDLINDVLKLIPQYRKKDVIYINPADANCKWGYNPLKKVRYEKRSLIVSSILDTFKKTWGAQAWGLRLEYILRNTLTTLLDQDHATFDDIPKLLLNESFRKKCMEHVVNPHVKKFWIEEFPKYGKTDLLPVLNKVNSFLTIPFLRRILVKNKTQLSIRNVMDSKKILLVNLSKGNLGDASYLLGGLLLTAISSAVFSRIDTPEAQREPFFVFLDEFHNYTTDTVISMLSEHRKFKVGYVLAHQYLGQLKPSIRDAVLGNIGTIICFKLGQADARYMEKEFYPVFTTSDFINLKHYHIYLKLLVHGKVSQGFSAKTITYREIYTA